MNGLTTLENKLVLAFPDAMNADAFYRFSRANPNLRMELNSNGEVEIMAGTGGKTGIIENEIAFQLTAWNRRSGLGKAFSPSTGFRLKNGSVRLSDGAWMRLDRWNALSPDDQQRFPPAPDFVVEVRSPSDDLNALKSKMDEWMQNGVALAWLIDPDAQTAYIYRQNGERLIVKGFHHSLSGEDVLPEFELRLGDLR